MWRPFDEGATLGQSGSESGVIIVDEEYGDWSRITLERDATNAPLSVTCGVYGWFFHTRLCGSTEAADLDGMRKSLGSICELARQYEESGGDDEARASDYEAIEAFVALYS